MSQTRLLSAFFALLLLMATSVALAAPTVAELENAVQARISRVAEFKFIAEEARKHGVRVYLFGGTAAGFAHYVNWDLRREQGDKRYRPDRFDYDFINIYRSTQDLDIVVDGSSEKAAELQKALVEKYPSFQGSKSQWEVRLLRQDLGDKQALLNNPDFMNQHTDSNSTGLIDVTAEKGEPVVRDLRDWDSRESQFSRDVVEGRIHYYFSPGHETTSRAKDGLNPAILSVIRLLTKAYQYELQIRPEDEAKVRRVIGDFDPKAKLSSYVSSWLEKNAPKLVRHAVNIEFAIAELDRLDLRAKLISIKGDANSQDTMAWWLSREPLKSRPVGQGSGKTAAEHGIKIVAHETNSFLSFESITRSHTNEPNVLTSRTGAVGEAAAFGEGFYTGVGRRGRRGTGWTIRFAVDPKAREGTDFFLAASGDFVVFTNKKALRVIQEDMNVTMPQYFRLLETIDAADRGILEKIRRRLADSLKSPNAKDLATIKRMILALPGGTHDKSGALAGWMREPLALQHLDLVEALIKKGKFTNQIFNDFLKPNPLETRPLIELAIQRKVINVNDGLLALLEIPGASKEPALRERAREAVLRYPDHNLTHRYFSIARYPEDAKFFTEFTKYDGLNKLAFSRSLVANLDQPGWGRSPDFITWIRYSFSLDSVNTLVHLAQSADLSADNVRELARFIEERLPANHSYFTMLMKPLSEAYEVLEKRFTLGKASATLLEQHSAKIVAALETGVTGQIGNQLLAYLNERKKLTPAIVTSAIRALPTQADLQSVIQELAKAERTKNAEIATAIVERYVSLDLFEQSKMSSYEAVEAELKAAVKRSVNLKANEEARISLLAFKRSTLDGRSPVYPDEATRLKAFARRLEAGFMPGSQFDVRTDQMKWESITAIEGRFLTEAEEKILLEKVIKFGMVARTKEHKRYALEMMIEVLTATRPARDPKVVASLKRALGVPQTDWGGSALRYLAALEDLSKLEPREFRYLIEGHSMGVGFLTNLSQVHRKSFAELAEGRQLEFASEAVFIRAIASAQTFDPANHGLLVELLAKNQKNLQSSWLPKQAKDLKKSVASYRSRFAIEIAAMTAGTKQRLGKSVGKPMGSNPAAKRSCQAVFL